MGKLAGFAKSATAIALTIFSVATAPLVEAGTQVPLNGARRGCDFSKIGNTNFGPVPTGQGDADISINGNTVTADVHFFNSRYPNAHYEVGLIQIPRPASSFSCGPGAPGTAYAGFDTDASAQGAVTLQSPIQPGAHGVWVKIERPSPHSQLPAESYSTVFAAPI